MLFYSQKSKLKNFTFMLLPLLGRILKQNSWNFQYVLNHKCTATKSINSKVLGALPSYYQHFVTEYTLEKDGKGKKVSPCLWNEEN